MKRFDILKIINHCIFFSKKKKLNREEKLNLLGDTVVKELASSTFEGNKLSSKDFAYVIKRIEGTAVDLLNERAAKHFKEYSEAMEAETKICNNEPKS